MRGEQDHVVGQILGKIGKRVTFLYPENESHAYGILKDRYVLPTKGRTGVPYWDVVDLIEFPNEPEPDWIRIGYYRKPDKRLVWGSQTTITEPIETWKHLLVNAAKTKPWFRRLIEQVAKQVTDSLAEQGVGGNAHG